jgi:hypothetical protein
MTVTEHRADSIAVAATGFKGMLSALNTVSQGTFATIDQFVFSNNFKIVDVTDNTKILNFNVSNLVGA